MEWLAHVAADFLARWGNLALAGGLLGESAGLPLPGETILMSASFVAHKTSQLNIFLVILVGTAAAVLGDNLGYWAGKRAGPRLLSWLKRKFNLEEDIAVAAEQIRRHGGATIFWARYIVGLRTIAGPVAGALHMEWKKFFLSNLSGAACWITSMALIGYLFAARMHSLGVYIEKASWVISGTIFGVGYILWRKKKRKLREHSNQSA